MSRRMTVTLDEDVARKVDEEARTTGQPLAAVVNDVLRRGLTTDAGATEAKPFHVQTFDMGSLRPGFSLECIGTLLAQMDELEPK